MKGSPETHSRVLRLSTGVLCCSFFLIEVCAQNLLPNGSFEDGALSPAGWNARPEGTVKTNNAHSGRYSVSGSTRRRAIVWESDTVTMNPQTDYRLEGWIRWSKD